MPLTKVTPNMSEGGGILASVVFDAISSNAILSSYNVASITDNGVGDWDVNFTNTLPTYYSYSVEGGRSGGSAPSAMIVPYVFDPATTYISFNLLSESNGSNVKTNVDYTRISMVAFGGI